MILLQTFYKMENNMDAKTRAANRLRQQRYRELHREEINDKRRQRYGERKLKSRCPRCGGKAKKGYTLCAECCEYQGVLNKKYAKKRKTAPASAKTVKKPVKVLVSAKKPVRYAAAKKATTVKKAAKPSKKPVIRTSLKKPEAVKKTTKKTTSKVKTGKAPAKRK